MRYLLITLAFFSVYSPKWAAATEVGHAGALYNFMHGGDLSAKFALADLKDMAHVYALGAAENLKGEIQIFDAKPAVTYAQDGEVRFDSSFDRKASLIVYAQVPEWQELPVPENTVTRQQLQDYLTSEAPKYGVDTSKPVPFLLAGKAKAIDWHVIDWDPADTVHTHLKHTNSGPHGRLLDMDALILGFYSDKHRAIFTHHESDLHLHFITTDGTLAGHIDNLELGQGMILKLPKE